MALTQIGDFVNLVPFLKQAPNSALWLSYDQEADVLYINFKKPSVATDTELTDDDVIVRRDGDGIVGFSVLHASQRTQSSVV